MSRRNARWRAGGPQPPGRAAGAVATLRRDLEVRASQIEERRALLGRRLAEVEQRLARHAVDRERADRAA